MEIFDLECDVSSKEAFIFCRTDLRSTLDFGLEMRLEFKNPGAISQCCVLR